MDNGLRQASRGAAPAMVLMVRVSGHVYTENRTFRLPRHDPNWRKTYKAKLWVGAKDDRHEPPLIV